MIGELENSVCPVCGGSLHANLATIPFILEHDTVVVIKGVPAESGLTLRDCAAEVWSDPELRWNTEGVIVNGVDERGHWANPPRPNN